MCGAPLGGHCCAEGLQGGGQCRADDFQSGHREKAVINACDTCWTGRSEGRGAYEASEADEISEIDKKKGRMV